MRGSVHSWQTSDFGAKGASAFAANDPYVVNGLVKNWRVREWTTVVGEGAASVVRP